MSQQVYRANLGAATFPLIAENFGRSVIIPQYDQSAAGINSRQDLDGDSGIPQLYYCHNVMPSAEGLQSIGYEVAISAVSPTEDKFGEVHVLRDADENKAYFVHASDGRNFVSLAPFYTWTETTNVPGTTADTVISISHNAGETYIYFSYIGCYKYVFSSNTLVAVTLTGLTAANILGIIDAQGYMIAYTPTYISWSSVLDPTDFVPSSVTGAGGAALTPAKGKITICIPSEYGFIVFTTNNAVAAAYSGNAAFPFQFSELKSAGGLASKDFVTYAANSSSIFAYTTFGLQEFRGSAVKTIFPEITDFVAGYYFEDFNESTLTFSRQSVEGSTMKKQIRLVSDRYLIVSYGVSELTHAIVVDLSLGRFGKLKNTHVDIFEWSVLPPEMTETPKKSIALMKETGEVQIVDFSITDEYSNGIAILGKYQFVRTNLLHMNTIYIENVRVVTNFYLYSAQEIEGKETPAFSACTLIKQTNTGRLYGVDKSGVNHSFLLKGGFQLSTIQLNFTLRGMR